MNAENGMAKNVLSSNGCPPQADQPSDGQGSPDCYALESHRFGRIGVFNNVAEQKFELGLIVATPGALHALEASSEEFWKFLFRHAAGDWGELSDADRAENEFSLANGLRLLSCYTLRNGAQLWIITEADQSSTTLLLPTEYGAKAVDAQALVGSLRT